MSRGQKAASFEMQDSVPEEDDISEDYEDDADFEEIPVDDDSKPAIPEPEEEEVDDQEVQIEADQQEEEQEKEEEEEQRADVFDYVDKEGQNVEVLSFGKVEVLPSSTLEPECKMIVEHASEGNYSTNRAVEHYSRNKKSDQSLSQHRITPGIEEEKAEPQASQASVA